MADFTADQIKQIRALAADVARIAWDAGTDQSLASKHQQDRLNALKVGSSPVVLPGAEGSEATA